MGEAILWAVMAFLTMAIGLETAIFLAFIRWAGEKIGFMAAALKMREETIRAYERAYTEMELDKEKYEHIAEAAVKLNLELLRGKEKEEPDHALAD